jgi:NAD(P)-dependent dehydrogenase (short-subunit alcohol dehydrogenase family)
MEKKGVFLVTGGSRGIGAAVALLAAKNGYSVAIFYREREDEASRVVYTIEAAGGRALAVRVDVSDETALLSGFESVDKFGHLQVLVNNAGVTGGISRLEDLSAATIEQVCRVNIVGTFLASREAVRRMSTRHGGSGGSIINVSSGASVHGTPNTWIHYAASKGAIDTLTIGLSKEVAQEGIRVNAVRPGVINTDIHEHRTVAQMMVLEKAIPMGRFGTPEEIAEVILWLASPQASYVIGTLLDARGGY